MVFNDSAVTDIKKTFSLSVTTKRWKENIKRSIISKHNHSRVSSSVKKAFFQHFRSLKFLMNKSVVMRVIHALKVLNTGWYFSSNLKKWTIVMLQKDIEKRLYEI